MSAHRVALAGKVPGTFEVPGTYRSRYGAFASRLHESETPDPSPMRMAY